MTPPIATTAVLVLDRALEKLGDEGIKSIIKDIEELDIKGPTLAEYEAQQEKSTQQPFKFEVMEKIKRQTTTSAYCWIIGISPCGYAPCRESKRWVNENLGKNYKRYTNYGDCWEACKMRAEKEANQKPSS